MASIRSWTCVSTFTLLCFFTGLLVPVASARPPRKSRRVKRPPPPTTGKLKVFSVAKGAYLEVDGRPRGRLPMARPLVLEPGSHSIRVWKRGYLEYLENAEIFAGETVELDADLIAVAGMVKVYANVPGARVFIDGKLAGEIPFDKDIPSGKHILAVQAKDHTSFEQEVDVIAGKWLEFQVSLRPLLAPSPSDDGSVASKWWFWTIIGTVVLGGAATGLALGLQSDKETSPPAPSQVLNLR
ncbi:MAG: PEGA domain-containing protein [Myxococcota bacterium]|nr:PEGA domain-containing protein [Myxococcota bacterium]